MENDSVALNALVDDALQATTAPRTQHVPSVTAMAPPAELVLNWSANDACQEKVGANMVGSPVTPTEEEDVDRIERARRARGRRRRLRSMRKNGLGGGLGKAAKLDLSESENKIDKKAQRIIRNREVALKARQQAKAKMRSLQNENVELRGKASDLLRENSNLKWRIDILQQSIKGTFSPVTPEDVSEAWRRVNAVSHTIDAATAVQLVTESGPSHF